MADKVAIIYYSKHHLNTKRLLDAIKEKYTVDLISLSNKEKPDLSEYKAVGFASGIYFNKLHKSVSAFVNMNKAELSGKRTFIICTSGSGVARPVQSFGKFLEESGLRLMGSFHCRAYDTFGPFKLIGGLNKGRPSKEDLEKAVSFYERILSSL